MRKEVIHKICLIIAITYLAITSVYAALPKTSNVPGGVINVALGKINSPRPKAFFNHHRVIIVPNHKKWTAVVGIPLATKPGTAYLIVKTTNGTKRITLTIKPKFYRKNYITIKKKRLVAPDKKDLDRIWREKKVINKALLFWSDQDNINMHFMWPVKGRISTPFGLQRYFNGKPRSSHSGIDIAVPKNTPIKAPANGLVVLTGNYFFMGNAVLINHGQGLITVYCHLNKIVVKPKQRVKRGQVIAYVGQTGRATGPHLHWGVRLNDTPVNPELFL
jgi:murein DD-endopeptidase MepM/ murein hydrolase activator NlpD